MRINHTSLFTLLLVGIAILTSSCPRLVPGSRAYRPLPQWETKFSTQARRDVFPNDVRQNPDGGKIYARLLQSSRSKYSTSFVNLDQFKDNAAVNDLRYQVISRYGHLLVSPHEKTIDTALIEQTRHWLADFPESLRLYETALTKLENRLFLRNLLDDLRLSLEKLTQKLLQNNRSLENQIADLGPFLKASGCSKELTNMFQKLIDYYTKYQNTYVKHDDAVIENEIEIIFEMTCSFMRFLVRAGAKSLTSG